MLEKIGRSPLLLGLLLTLSAGIGAAAVLLLAPVAGGDDARIEQAVKDTILDHPEILPEAMDRLRARDAAKAVAGNRDAIETPFAGAWEGAQDADVTIVAYMDYACGYCRASLPVLDELLAADPRLRVVYRELPVLSEESRTAAQWSLAAAEQGKYIAFHDALYAAGQLSEATIEAAIAAAGLDRARAERAIASPAVAQEIGRNLSVAQALGLTGTPSWVIGDQPLSGLLSADAMRAAVAAARERG